MSFVPNNPHASTGGRTRAKVLTPARRREIAKKGAQRHYHEPLDPQLAQARAFIRELYPHTEEPTLTKLAHRVLMVLERP